ncbi:putative mRNA (2'-O-methyladenosine-N(6)-)-methyltransferase [Helianthus annuus]|nr:putative mRNA (2'-O-methyladenosine-N(6)-)-methyltransferase [Helianthus annuus]KAJ0674953.1 putative mRNA (2'-O-methyladenosine-N(6)-)-methyltransferase [Helianthus annuus]
MQVTMMGSPFGPPGGLQPLTPTMSPGPGPPMSPAVFIPPFSPAVVWPGVGIPPGGPSGPIFPPNIGTPQNPNMYFHQPRPVRAIMPPNMPGPGFNALGPPMGPTPRVPPRNNGPPGKAPSRGEQNDYSQNFVDTGMRPQNFIRELELTSVVEDYPKLRELIQKKDEIVANSASAPMYYKCDLREQVLSPEFFGTKFDVILVDPPWDEYVHRAPGVADHMEYWTFEEIMNLKIEVAIADTPSFVFLWVGDGVGLEQGRQCLKKAYVQNFADKDGKVWQGGGGRNPPPEASHLVLTTPDIEALRPKSPMKNQLQMQQQSQQSNTISLTPGGGGGGSNKRLLHTKRENSTQKTSLVGERAHLVYKPHISCPYNRCGTSPIPCNGISP